MNFTALMMAARYSNTTSNVRTVKLLLGSGADVNMKNNDGSTALMLAARYSNTDSNIETVRLLLDSRSDPFIVNTEGKNFISYLNLNGKKEMECFKITQDFAHHNLCMKKVMGQIKLVDLYSPNNYRIKLMNIKWDLENMSYKLFLEKQPEFVKYFGIYDDESLKTKIMDNLKYLD